MLYNIFSNFGNILKIIYIRPKAAALLEFETVEYATISKDYLNNIVFMGKPLRVIGKIIINLIRSIIQIILLSISVIRRPAIHRRKSSSEIKRLSDLRKLRAYLSILPQLFSIFPTLLKICVLKMLLEGISKHMEE
jgi:hypothetical protein